MVRKQLAIALALAAVACKRSPPQPDPGALPYDPAVNDRLLARAPAGTRLAIVASGRGLAFVEAAIARVRQLAKASSDFAFLGELIDDALARILGRRDLHTLAELGLATDRGFARFQLDDGATVTIWPVRDRARFVAALRGRRGADGLDDVQLEGRPQRCGERQQVYACADAPALLDRLGSGALRVVRERVGVRGDLELVGPGAGPWRDVAAAAVLFPGRVTVRGKVGLTLPTALAVLADPAVNSRAVTASGIDASRLSAAAWISLPRQVLTTVPLDGAPPLARTLQGALAGRATAEIRSGTRHLEVRIPFAEVAVARELLDDCAHLWPVDGIISARPAGDGCRVTVAGAMKLSFMTWRDIDALCISDRRGGHLDYGLSNAPDATDLGRELIGGSWNVAFWGRGSLLGAGPNRVTEALAASQPEAAAMAALFSALSELAVAGRVDPDGVAFEVDIRTVFGNPREIVDRLPRILARVARGEDVRDDVQALVDTHPGSPFARDVAAGDYGLNVPVVPVVAALQAAREAMGDAPLGP